MSLLHGCTHYNKKLFLTLFWIIGLPRRRKKLSQELETKMGSKTTYTKLVPNRKICQIKTLKKEISELWR
jgi:hypothetical protein